MIHPLINDLISFNFKFSPSTNRLIKCANILLSPVTNFHLRFSLGQHFLYHNLRGSNHFHILFHVLSESKSTSRHLTSQPPQYKQLPLRRSSCPEKTSLSWKNVKFSTFEVKFRASGPNERDWWLEASTPPCLLIGVSSQVWLPGLTSNSSYFLLSDSRLEDIHIKMEAGRPQNIFLVSVIILHSYRTFQNL